MFLLLYNEFNEWAAASIPVSWSAHTCKELVQLMPSVFKTNAITFPAIFLKTFPTLVGLRPEFSCSGVNLHKRRASMVWVSIRCVHRFLTTFADAF